VQRFGLSRCGDQRSRGSSALRVVEPAEDVASKGLSRARRLELYFGGGPKGGGGMSRLGGGGGEPN
jgi:hypothetical protein